MCLVSKVAVVSTLGFAGFLAGCSSKPPEPVVAPVEAPAAFSAVQTTPMIGDQKVIRLKRKLSADESKPQFVSVELLPGRGMNVFQIKARVPGLGVINLLESPTLEVARERMNGGESDYNGNQSFKMGGAILLPFANRMRGKLVPGAKQIETQVMDKNVRIPANWQGKNPGAELHANHGFILSSGMTSFRTEADNSHAAAFAVLQAGDFSERWPSKMEVSISATLTDASFVLRVTAKNVGGEVTPVGIGWHPYFTIPSGDRAQARIVIPARQRVLVDNYDNVFPTGKTEPVAGTAYDVSVSSGLSLGKQYLDDTFVALSKDDQGRLEIQLLDPAARYGLRIMGVSKEINAVQVYSPSDKAFIAVEPQFNYADPFSPVWKGQDTGMVKLKPGESVTYGVVLMLFIP
jgi:aldose 1-epimerase